MTETNKVGTLVLDAHPLITQHYSTLSKFAETFYTTPTIYHEIRDENARRNLALWGDNLKIRHPKPESIKRVTDFARLTGDFNVLSANDLHIIALTYELDVELNNSEEHLRKYPGEKLPYQIKQAEERQAKAEALKKEQEAKIASGEDDGFEVVTKRSRRSRRAEKLKREEEKERLWELAQPDEDGWQSVVKGWKQKPTVEEPVEETEQLATQVEQIQIEDEKEQESPQLETETEQIIGEAATPEENDQEIQDAISKLDSLKIESKTEDETKPEELTQDYDENDDDGEWITSENLIETIIKDSGNFQSQSKPSVMNVALASQDFAVQNTSLQLGLNLMNILSGLRIKRVRNYMLRCHACFTMVPIPKNGDPKHFCPKCGGQTLMRCAVSIDSSTGNVYPHLKANFQWRTRGDRYSLASPLSKASQKRYGNKGFVHNKSNKQKATEEPILREDQKEYQRAINDDKWLRRQNDKILNDYIGGGSADNFISPFASQGFRSSGVKVGKGRYVNSSKRKK